MSLVLRSGPASEELIGAVAQVQGTVHGAVGQIGAKFVGQDTDRAPTGEEAFNYQPRSFLVIGTLSEFMGPNGVNTDQYRSFELYRRNTAWPEIITFDELYERASYIVNHNGSAKPAVAGLLAPSARLNQAVEIR